MKKILYTAVAILMLASCTESKIDNGVTTQERVPLHLRTTSIATRVTNDEWDGGEVIGVTMYNQAEYNSNRLVAIGERYTPYVATRKGLSTSFEVESGTEPLYFLTQDDVVISAIYPNYPGLVATGEHTIDFSDQEDLSQLDFMSALVRNVSKSKEAVELTFQRYFTKVSVVLTPGEGFSAEDMKGAAIEICKVATQYTVKIDGDPVVSTGDIEMNNSSAPLFEAIFNAPDHAPTFTITVGEYLFTLTSPVVLGAGEHHTFTITVSRTPLGVTGEITEWSDNDGGELGAESEFASSGSLGVDDINEITLK